MATHIARVFTNIAWKDFDRFAIDQYIVGAHGELVLVANEERPYNEVAIATYAPGVWKAIFVTPIKSDKE